MSGPCRDAIPADSGLTFSLAPEGPLNDYERVRPTDPVIEESVDGSGNETNALSEKRRGTAAVVRSGDGLRRLTS